MDLDFSSAFKITLIMLSELAFYIYIYFVSALRLVMCEHTKITSFLYFPEIL